VRVGATAAEVVGERPRQSLGIGFVHIPCRIDRRHEIEIGPRLFRGGCLGGAGEGLRGPFGKAQRQEREIEKPLTGIIDDIEVEHGRAGPAAPPLLRLEFQHQPQLADPARSFRPVWQLARQRTEMLLVGKAWDRSIGRFREFGADEPAGSKGGKAGHPTASEKIVDQCGDKDRLAGAA
jgi:hypothetical protein